MQYLHYNGKYYNRKPPEELAALWKRMDFVLEMHEMLDAWLDHCNEISSWHSCRLKNIGR